MEWEVISHTKDHRIESLATEYGEWMISHPTWEKNLEAKISFTSMMPGGFDMTKYQEQMTAAKANLPEGKKWSNELSRIHHYISPREIGYAQNFEEAELLIQYMMQGDADMPDVHTTLTEAGFSIRNQFDNWRGHFDIYEHKDKGNLDITVADDSIHMSYNASTGMSWTNIMRLTGDHLNDHRRLEMIEVYWPENIKDYKRVGAAYCVDITNRRIKRGGLFKKALQECDFVL